MESKAQQLYYIIYNFNLLLFCTLEIFKTAQDKQRYWNNCYNTLDTQKEMKHVAKEITLRGHCPSTIRSAGFKPQIYGRVNTPKAD